MDATALAVCRNQRIGQHRVFAGLAARGKTSMGWFYGFKLHLVANDCGELLACQLTPGNIDDHQPVPILARRLCGKLFGDKGYLSRQLVAELLETCQVQLVTFARSNMQGRLLHQDDVLLLRKRTIIETISDQLKNISHIEHSGHRSPFNFVVNLLSGLIAYCWQPQKPSLHLQRQPLLPVSYTEFTLSMCMYCTVRVEDHHASPVGISGRRQSGQGKELAVRRQAKRTGDGRLAPTVTRETLAVNQRQVEQLGRWFQERLVPNRVRLSKATGTNVTGIVYELDIHRCHRSR